ncbi:MAG TPA: hypothetical protein VMY18_00495 [Acidobacteriota bacterium]|nr:hypothetical protein [Acidobacteriota bacterium]
MELILLLLLAIFGCVGYGMLKRYLLDQALVKRREMVHKERIIAMEKGLPIENLQSGDESLIIPGSSQEKVLVWVRLASLCVGLFLLLAGAGICIAFHFTSVSDLRDIWTIGVIPVLAGVGLLLFFVLSKGFKENLKSE